MIRQNLWLVNGNQRATIVNPHQSSVLEMLHQPFSMGSGHQLVLISPDDQHRPLK